MNDIKRRLAAPFPEFDIEWRVGQSGVSAQGRPWAKVLAYVDARAVMDRLDDVLGLAAWSDDYVLIYEAQKIIGVSCTLTARIGEATIQKCDASPVTDIEPLKGGYSKALVRTAVKYGIGRYLYALETTWAECVSDAPAEREGWHYARDAKTQTKFWWKRPTLPPSFLPPNERSELEESKPDPLKTAKASLWQSSQAMGYTLQDLESFAQSRYATSLAHLNATQIEELNGGLNSWKDH